MFGGGAVMVVSLLPFTLRHVQYLISPLPPVEGRGSKIHACNLKNALADGIWPWEGGGCPHLALLSLMAYVRKAVQSSVEPQGLA